MLCHDSINWILALTLFILYYLQSYSTGHIDIHYQQEGMDNQWKAQETAPRTEENVQEQLLRARNITEHPQPGYQGYGVMPQKGAGKGPKIALMPRRKEEQSQTA